MLKWEFPGLWLAGNGKTRCGESKKVIKLRGMFYFGWIDA